MKRYLVIILILLASHSFAQPNIQFRMTAAPVVDLSFASVYEFKSSYTTVNSYFPIKTGLNIIFRLPPHFSMITGYNLLYRFMSINMYTTTVGNLFYGYKMYTSEIPLIFRYDGDLKNTNIGLYAELGASFDFMYANQNVFGRTREILDFIVVKKWAYYYTMELPWGFIPALHAKAGFTSNIGKNKGILDIGVNYHQQIPKRINNNIIYYYSSGLGSITRENSQFYTGSSYLGFDFSYFLPFKITFSNNKKTE